MYYARKKKNIKNGLNMRERVIEFIVANTSYSYDELKTWSDKELDDFMGRSFPVEY